MPQHRVQDQHSRQPALSSVPQQLKSKCPRGAQQKRRAREVRPRNDHQIQRSLPFPFWYRPSEPGPLDQERVQCFGPKPCHTPVEFIIGLYQPIGQQHAKHIEGDAKMAGGIMHVQQIIQLRGQFC